jgi:hypothetical protein
VIDALRVFYEKDDYKYKRDRDEPCINTHDLESWIEVTFSLEQSEFDLLPTKYQNSNKELRVRKALYNTPTHKPGFIYAYLPDGTLSDESFFGAKNVQSAKFGNLIYITAVSKVDDHTKLTGPSALRDLLNDVLTDVIINSAAHAQFVSDFDRFAQDIKSEKTVDNRSVTSLENDLQSLLASWGVNVSLAFKAPSLGDIIKGMISLQLQDQNHTKILEPENFGSGFQRHFIASLIQIKSKHEIKPHAFKAATEFAPRFTIILFEEPEAFLHPPQQEILARNLMEIANHAGQQVICSTHSPHFVSRNAQHISGMIRMKRETGIIRCAQVDDVTWQSIVNSNQQINQIALKYPDLKKRFHPDDALPEMESVKRFLWLNPDRCGMFFATHVLLVEGPTELGLINVLIADGKISKANCGLHIVECIGKFNIHRFMNLLSALEVPHSVIHDADPGKEEQAAINALIQDSAHHRWTYRIEVLPNDVESLLGVPACKIDHRKPQHVIYHYDQNKIDPMKLNAFCLMIDDCLP